MATFITAEQLFAAFFYLIGLILILFYIGLCPRLRLDEDPSPTWNRDFWQTEYENLRNEVSRREHSMIMMGSIFIPVCFLLMGTAATSQHFLSRLLIVSLSVTLYSVWLFSVQLTSWVLAERTYPRLRWLENHIGFEVLVVAIREMQDSKIMIIRRHHWLFYMIGLFIVGILIILLV